MSFTLTRCDLVHETDDALLVRLSIEDKRYAEPAYWIPLSQVEKLVRSTKPFQSEVTMTDWVATQKEFK